MRNQAAMDGILNLIKPPDMTSFDVVAYLRGLLKIKKIGHTGTLDPQAVGVLPVCTGRATKAIEFLMEKDKTYRAELVLGISTDTQDAGGNITDARDTAATPEEIEEAVGSFIGGYRQVPPMYSAVRVGGRRLYEFAREGRTIERESRDVVIHKAQVLHVAQEKRKTAGHIYNVTRVIFDVSCSKGTYIRTLCADIGDKLGCGGHMSFLVRTRAGSFDISSALTLQDVGRLHADGRLEDHLIGIDAALENFRALSLAPSDLKRLQNGAPVMLRSGGFREGEILRVYAHEGSFAALAVVNQKGQDLLLKVKKLF